MASYSADDAKKRYAKLPPEIKNLLYSPGMSFTIQQIGQKNKLHLDQIDILNTETGQLMLGFIDPKDFNTTLMEMLNLDRTQADAVMQDVNEMLLAPIREAMKKIYADIVSKQSEIQNPAAMSMPPLTEGKSVVMPSSIAKTVGAETGHANMPAVQTPAATSSPSVAPKPVVSAIPSPGVTIPAAAPKPAGLPVVPKVDTMLSEPTVSIAPAPVTPAAAPAGAPVILTPAEAPKVAPPKPGPIYKTDPYHEPID